MSRLDVFRKRPRNWRDEVGRREQKRYQATRVPIEIVREEFKR